MKISVCMATYNGAAFIEEQLTSILDQLKPTDELVIVDDCSKDDTLAIVARYQDARFRIYRNDPNSGVNPTFARAISLCDGDIILMADQDDRWLPGRVDAMVQALTRSGASVVAGNMLMMDAVGNPIPSNLPQIPALTSLRHVKNIVDIFSGGTGYFGCAMGFRRSLVPLILPFPALTESHDLWIALAGNVQRSVVHIDDNVLIRRIHGNNASVIQRGLLPKLRSRLVFGQALAVLAWRKLIVPAGSVRPTAAANKT